MAEAEFLIKLAEILEVAPGEVDRSTQLAAGQLDSLALLSMIAAIDEEFGVAVPLDALGACRDVEQVLALVRAARS